MSVLGLLIVIGLLLAGVFLSAFLWAVRSGQFDDTLTPSLRILGDGEPLEVKRHLDMKEGGIE